MTSRKRCGSFLVSVALVAANLIVFNMISLAHFTRLDLTRSKLYTLHPATLELLHGLDDLVTLRVFLSEKRFSDNQGYSNIPRTIRDMVEEFVAQSNGRLKADFIDPTDDPDKERDAESAGIQSVQVSGMSAEQSQVFKVYCGIAISYGGKEDQKIPVAYFQTEEYRLELELDLAIARLTRRETITIGVNAVNELPEGIPPQMAAQMGQQQDKYDIDQDYRLVRQELERLYEVEKVSVKSPIPDHIQLLVVANTEGLDDRAKYHIDQYLMNGGQLLVLAAGTSMDQRMGGPVACGTDNDDFFRHYGFTIDKNLVLDRQGLATSPFQPPVYFAPVMLPRNFNAESSLMTGVGSFALVLSSSIHLNPPEGVTPTVLATTTPLAWQQTGYFTLEPTQPQANPPENAEEFQTFDMVGLLEGEFTSYFSNRALPEGVGTAAHEPTATEIGDQIDEHAGHDHADEGDKKDEEPKSSGDGNSTGGGSGGSDPQEGTPTPAPAPVTPPVQDPPAQDPPATPPATDPAAAQDPPPAVPAIPGAAEGALPPAAPPTFVKAKSPKTRIVVIGSNWFLMPLRQFGDAVNANYSFFLTIVERMTTGSRLSDLRNRTVQRPAIKGDLSGTTQLTIKWFGILGMPAIVAAFGLIMWMLRKNRRPVLAA